MGFADLCWLVLVLPVAVVLSVCVLFVGLLDLFCTGLLVCVV